MSEYDPCQALNEAANWLVRGVAVIPLWWGEKRPALSSWEGYQARLPNPDELLAWFSQPSRPRNLGVVTGWQGLTVLDFDRRDLYDLWLDALNPSPTYTVRTPRGAHAYYFLEKPTRSTKTWGIDVQAAGKYVVAPPSIHPSGAPYEVDCALPIAHVPNLQAVCPEWMFCEPPPALATAPRLANLPSAPILASALPLATIPLDPMACLPGAPNLVATIKDRVSLLQFFPNARPTRAGYYLDLCPFHDDHNPSFWIDTNRQICGCFAGCTNKSMDVINFTARLWGLSNHDAIEALRARL